MRKTIAVALVAVCGMSSAQTAPVKEHPIPRLEKKDGRYALMVDNAPYLMLGAQSNNSSDWPATLPDVWAAIEYLHANTLEIPIYWEQFEPKPGQFDYSAVDLLLAQARQRHVHLVLLWFGTWKNGSQHYMPEWMKLNPIRYFRVMNKEGEYVDSPSPFATASLDEDKKAFATLMKHLKEADAERTVLMVQVENETGTWGTTRDYSPQANKLFNGSVPPEVLKAMGKTPVAPGANWETAFGAEAEIYFHAWAIAKYVEQVAAVGKAIYPLPMYVNASLHDPLKPEVPVDYESGGPTDNVIAIWKAAAPAIDIEAPDIYLPGTDQYITTLEAYHRPDNPLFVPETMGSRRAARFFFSTLGLQAIGYSPFGLDYTRRGFATASEPNSRNAFLDPTAQNHGLIGPMMRDIARLNFEGKLQATAEPDDESPQILHFGDWDAVVTYKFRRWPMENANQKREPLGRALVAQLGANQFLVTGIDCTVDFRPAGTPEQQKAGDIVFGTGQEPSAKIGTIWIHRQFLRVEEGQYVDGMFKFERILNGDQTDYLGDIYSGYFISLVQQHRNADAFQIIEKAHGRIEAQALEHHAAIPPHLPSRDEEQITRLNVRLINSDDPAARAEIERRIYQAELEMDAPRLAGLTSIRPVALKDLQRDLERGELLLEYVLGEQASYVMAVSHESVNSYSLPGKKLLETSATQYRKAIEQRKATIALSDGLFTTLLGNIPEYRNATSIIVVADGGLHLLPFSALWDGRKYVVQTHSVSIAPSATVLDVVREERHGPDSHEFVGVAAWTAERPSGMAGVLREVTAPELKQCVPLPQSLHEVTTIAQELPKPSIVLSGDNATETEFRSLPLNDYSVLHLALHGFVDKDYPDRSALVFAPERGGKNDGLLEAREIRNLQLNASLVTLSACDSGVGPVGESGIDNLAQSPVMSKVTAAVVLAPAAPLITPHFSIFRPPRADGACSPSLLPALDGGQVCFRPTIAISRSPLAKRILLLQPPSAKPVSQD